MKNKFIFFNNKGFSLIELLVVITIISVLAGVGVPEYFDHIKKVEENTAFSTAGSIKHYIESLLAMMEEDFKLDKTDLQAIELSGLPLPAACFTINSSNGNGKITSKTKNWCILLQYSASCQEIPKDGSICVDSKGHKSYGITTCSSSGCYCSSSVGKRCVLVDKTNRRRP